MAPTKFGLFKTRSRDGPDPPSTENLLQTSISSDQVSTPQSPIPSTSKGITEDVSAAAVELSTLRLYCDDDDDDDDDEDNILSPVTTPTGSLSMFSRMAESETDYRPLKTLSLDFSTSTPHKDQEFDDAATAYDANSLQFDKSPVATSTKIAAKSENVKKEKRIKYKTEKYLRDLDMWRASNVEVMQNLLSRRGSIDEQIKWEAIATSRGLCTLTDSCTCQDCTGYKFRSGVADGDAGLGAAPFLNAVNIGCRLQ